MMYLDVMEVWLGSLAGARLVVTGVGWLFRGLKEADVLELPPS